MCWPGGPERGSGASLAGMSRAAAAVLVLLTAGTRLLRTQLLEVP